MLQMPRRRFVQGSLGLAGLGLVSGCRVFLPRVQPAPRPVVGWISGASAEASAPITEAFRRGLREQGYTEGQAMAVEFRFADGIDQRLPDLVAELLALNVTVLVTSGTQAALTAKQATQSIPIVSVSADPVGTGLVASLARPGGNITGFRIQTSGLFGKRLKLLAQAVPGLVR